MEEKLTYNHNPYTSARIGAMKADLLRKSDYDKLMKMDVNEIIKYLQDGVYKEEINDLRVRYEGIELIEYALKNHLTKVFLKIKSISDSGIEAYVGQYLKRFDYWNVKIILRKIISGEEDVKKMFIPVGNLDEDKLDDLNSLSSVEEVLKESKLLKKEKIEDLISGFRQTGSLMEIENVLDYNYYKKTYEFVERIPLDGRLLIEFFKSEFDIYNLKLILKKVFFEIDAADVEPYVLFRGGYLRRTKLNKLLDKNRVRDFISELSNTDYDVLKHSQYKDKDVVQKFEIKMDRILFEKAIKLFHQNPLSVDIVLGYMFAKEIETQNIRTIVKSNAFEFTEDYVKDRIIIR